MSNATRRARRAARRILWCGDGPGGNYAQRVIEIGLGREPGLYHVGVCHDDTCPALRSTPGICRCDADVAILTEEQAIEIAVRGAS